jgi:membrane protease YdiL (CAAX protease family)
VVAIALQAPAAAWTAMLLYHGGCSIAATLGAGRLGRRPGAVVLVGVVGASAAAVVAPWALLRPVLPALNGPATSWGEWGFEPPHDLLLLVYYVTINPWLEEIFWRGTLLGPTFRRHLGTTAARLVALIGFLPMHFVVLGSSFNAGTALVMSCGVLVGSAAWVLMHEPSS